MQKPILEPDDFKFPFLEEFEDAEEILSYDEYIHDARMGDDIPQPDTLTAFTGNPNLPVLMLDPNLYIIHATPSVLRLFPVIMTVFQNPSLMSLERVLIKMN